MRGEVEGRDLPDRSHRVEGRAADGPGAERDPGHREREGGEPGAEDGRAARRAGAPRECDQHGEGRHVHARLVGENPTRELLTVERPLHLRRAMADLAEVLHAVEEDECGERPAKSERVDPARDPDRVLVPEREDREDRGRCEREDAIAREAPQQDREQRRGGRVEQQTVRMPARRIQAEERMVDEEAHARERPVGGAVSPGADEAAQHVPGFADLEPPEVVRGEPAAERLAMRCEYERAEGGEGERREAQVAPLGRNGPGGRTPPSRPGPGGRLLAIRAPPGKAGGRGGAVAHARPPAPASKGSRITPGRGSRSRRGRAGCRCCSPPRRASGVARSCRPTSSTRRT